jgi:hypothetical protein
MFAEIEMEYDNKYLNNESEKLFSYYKTQVFGQYELFNAVILILRQHKYYLILYVI